MEILLTSPVTPIVANKVRVSNISDHPNRLQLSFRLTIGYTDADGKWVEVRDYHELIQNTPAVLYNKDKPENEAKPASPQYDILLNLLKTSGKTAEEIILNRARAKFPGEVSE